MAIQTIARLQNRRGLYADLPTSLAEGEFGWCLDTRQLFIGNSNGYGANTEVLTAYSQNDELITTIYSANGINLSSAISRTLHAKLDDIASIKDFGAIGDGVTDDAPAINAAISELLKGYPASNNTAVSIFFPAGTYLINSTLLLYPYLSIIGDGNNGTTILAAPGTSMQYMLETVDSLGQTGANIGLNGAVLPTKVHIRDISINTNSQQISAVHSTRYTHIRYERVNVRGGWVSGNPAGTDSAFTCSSIGNAVFTHDLQLVDCDIQGFTNAVLMNDPVAYTTLSRCTLHQLYRGIVAGLTPAYNGPEYTTITQTKFYSISNYGIYVGDASSNPGVTSIGNTFKSVGTPTSVKSIYWGTASVLNGSMGDVFSTAPGVIDNGATNIIVDAQQTNLTGVSGTSGYSGYSGVFNSSSNASSATVIATGSTTARTLAVRAQRPFNVLDYGAVADGVTVSSAAFLAAYIAAGAAGGGQVFIPASANRYIVGGLTLSLYNNVSFVGENQTTNTAGGVQIQAASTSQTVFTVSSVSGVFFENILFTSASQQTAGAYVAFTGSNNCGVRNSWFTQGYDNITITNGSGAMWFDTLQVRNFNHDGFYISGASADIYCNNIIMDQDNSSYTPNAGFELPYMGGSFVLTNSDILHCHCGLLVNPGAGQFSIWGYLSNVYCDTSDFDIAASQGVGMSFSATNGGVIDGWKFDNVWASTAYVGVKLIADDNSASKIGGMDFVNLQVLNNLTNGVQIYHCEDVDFINPDIYSNSAAATGTYSGVAIGPYSDSVKFSMGEIGRTPPGFSNQHSYAIELQSGFAGVLTVNGTKMRGVSGVVLQTGTAAIGSGISQAEGFNPQGTALQTVGASPYTYTAGLSVENVNLYGGTGVVATVNGVPVANVSPCAFTLAPRQPVTITYITVPTMAVNKQ